MKRMVISSNKQKYTEVKICFSVFLINMFNDRLVLLSCDLLRGGALKNTFLFLFFAIS